MRILCVIVLYKSSLMEAVSYQTCVQGYLDDEDTGVFVYDNSPEPMSGSEALASRGIQYVHDGNNAGVSTAYNVGFEYAQAYHYEWLLLLDQDTSFPRGFLDDIRTAHQKCPSANLLIPSVTYQGGRPFSPVERSAFGSRPVALKEGTYNLADYLPVNSGACIRTAVYRQAGGYNLRIRLDFSDYDFFSRLCDVSPVFYLVDATASQSFSNEESDEEKLKSRFQLYVEGGREVLRNQRLGKRVLYRMIRHALALSIRTRNPYFVMYLIKHI